MAGYDDIGKLDSVTAVTNNAGVATVKWTCLVEISEKCARLTSYGISIVASTNVEDQLIQGKSTIFVSFAPCNDCHQGRR